MTASLLSRSTALLESEGWTVDVVERRTGPITRDLFGMFDLIAIRPAGGQFVYPEEGPTMAVQVTSASNLAARCRKIADSPHIAAVREAGWLVECHGWRLKGREWIVTRRDLS